MEDGTAYDEFVRARLPHLLRLGRALTCDDEAAAALVTESLVPVLARWDSSSPYTAEDDVRRDMVRRRLRSRETVSRAEPSYVDRDLETWDALAALTPQERALVALQLQEQLTEGQAADVVGCSETTAREVTARALDDLDPDRVRAALEEPCAVDEGALVSTLQADTARHRRRANLLVGAIALILTLVAAVVVVLAVQQDDGELSDALPARAYKLAAASPDQVWALTADPDCISCSQLWARSDGGWELRHTFERRAVTAELAMAPNGRDGWIWYADGGFLQATHDGGRTWVIPGVELQGAAVDLAVAGDEVWVTLQFPDETQMWSAPVDSDNWTQAAAPEDGADLFDLLPWGHQVLVSSYRDGKVSLSPAGEPSESLPPPCAEPRGFWATAGSSAAALWGVCFDADTQRTGFSLHSSADGRTWRRVGGLPSGFDLPVYPVSENDVLVRTIGRLVIVNAAEQVASDLDLHLRDRIQYCGFFDDGVGLLLLTDGEVLRSDDGGESWSTIG